MKILVTGALGHIGSSLIRAMPSKLKNLEEVVLIDNLSSQRYASLFNLPAQMRYQFFEADIRELELNGIVKEMDYVIHLAAITDAAGSFGNAIEVEENNFQCTEIIANACLKYGVKLITLSSTSVYGSQTDLVTEDCNAEDLNPQSPYAETKLKEEKLVQKLYENGLNVVCCRFGTIYGPSVGMRFHTAVNKFCWQASLGLPLTIWSTAYHQLRPYLDLKDAVNSLIFLIEKDMFDGEVYNILTENLSVCNVVDAIKTYIPDVSMEFVETKIMNQLSYKVSCKKFESRGFEFSGNLESGIKDTLSQIHQN